MSGLAPSNQVIVRFGGGCALDTLPAPKQPPEKAKLAATVTG